MSRNVNNFDNGESQMLSGKTVRRWRKGGALNPYDADKNTNFKLSFADQKSVVPGIDGGNDGTTRTMNANGRPFALAGNKDA